MADANYDGNVFEATLRMIYDVCIRKEMESLDSQNINQYLQNTSNHRSGLQVMNFLFDLINDIAGYTDKYYEESADKITHDGLVNKYRQERKNFTDIGLDQSELLGNHHPHCVLVIEGLQELVKMKGCNISTEIPGKAKSEFDLPVTVTKSLAQDYLDSIMIRLTPNSDNWYRNHFPVLMETNMSHYFNERIYNQANQDAFSYPTIEYGLPTIDDVAVSDHPFDIKEKLRHLNHIFNKD